jgi:hypothetical protein
MTQAISKNFSIRARWGSNPDAVSGGCNELRRFQAGDTSLVENAIRN